MSIGRLDEKSGFESYGERGEWLMGAGKTRAIRQLFEDFSRARQINEENLKTVLADNKNTVYGCSHGFADIHSMQEYRSRVPLTDYSAYEELVSVPNGLTAYPVACMLATSGTTNKQKLFPLNMTERNAELSVNTAFCPSTVIRS